MLLVVFGIILLAEVAVPVADFAFETSPALDFEFIYHGNKHLLLVIQGDNCYFAEMLDSTFLEHQKLDVLKELAIHIGTGKIANSTLDAMRDKYADLLADFRCHNKNIFTVNFTSDELTQGTHGLLNMTGVRLILHDDHGVMILIFGNNCYYANITEGIDQVFFQAYRHELLGEAARVMLNTSQPTTLEEMATIHKDVVAELDCVNKSVFTIKPDYEYMVQKIMDSTYKNESTNFKLIYHRDHDLLLAIRDRTCYYAVFNDTILQDWWTRCPMAVLAGVMNALDEGPVMYHTLEYVLKEFHDLAANFLCRHTGDFVDVYDIRLNATVVQDYKDCQTAS